MVAATNVAGQTGARETFTATAAVKAAGGAAATAPLKVTVDRKMSESEADTMLAAFKSGGAAGLRKALQGVPAVGSAQLGGGKPTPLRLALERPTEKGRLLTLVADTPILFLGAGVPGAKAQAGYDFAIIDLEVDANECGVRHAGASRQGDRQEWRVCGRGLRGRARAPDRRRPRQVVGWRVVTVPNIGPSAMSRQLLETSVDGILIIEADGTIAMVNRELEKQFGYLRDELVGQRIEVLVPEASRLAHVDLRDRYLRDPEARLMEPGREVHGRRKDGSEFPLVIGLTPLRSDSGLFVLATIVDLTERTRIDRTKAAGLEGPLEFERYIAELSAKFINVPIEQIVETIREGLGRVCLQLGLDRSGFCTFGPDGEMLQSVTWSAPGVMPIDERLADKDKFPWSLALIHAGEVVHFSSLEDIPNEIDRENFKGIGESVVVLPLSVDGSVKGSVCFGSMQTGHQWSGPALNRLSLIAAVFAQVIARYEREEATRKAAAEAHRLKEELQVENVYLKHEVRERLGSARIVGQSAAVRRVIDQIQQVAPTQSTVLLLGETGTGKELFATQIHELGPRRKRSMVRVNCAAIPPTLMESELFGRERGAFTGALARQIGPFRDGGSFDHLSRRNWRPAARRPGEAASGSGRENDRAARKSAADSRGRPDHRRDAPESREAGRRRSVQGGPVLPPECVSGRGSAAARSAGGHSVARVAVRRGVFEGIRTAHRLHRPDDIYGAVSNIPGRATSASFGMSSSAP